MDGQNNGKSWLHRVDPLKGKQFRGFVSDLYQLLRLSKLCHCVRHRWSSENEDRSEEVRLKSLGDILFDSTVSLHSISSRV